MPSDTATDLVNVSLRLPKDLLEAIDARASSIDPSSPNRSLVVRQALARQLAVERKRDRRPKLVSVQEAA